MGLLGGDAGGSLAGGEEVATELPETS